MISRKTLLLNNYYECISFITERKMLKLVVKDKVEVLSNWDDDIRWSSGSFKRPAVVKLRYNVPRVMRKKRYHKSGIFKRDRYVCQYCGRSANPSKLTIDHVRPKSMGGKKTWDNCVAACFTCNNIKGDRTPGMAGMSLLREPTAPEAGLSNDYAVMNEKHESWEDYIR
jgi:5-methylcytosine-specific restriction endonuclease McrA